MPKVSEAAKTRHCKLIADISNYIAPKVDEYEYKQCKTSLRAFLNPLEQKECDDIMDILRVLEKRGHIGVGRYDKIRDILEKFDVSLGDQIDEAIDDIQKIESGQSNQDIHTTSSDGPIQDLNGATKRKSDDPPVSTSSKRSKKDNVYDCENTQKGYMVIINCKKDRPGSLVDVKKLQNLFHGKLGFDIEEVKEDPTKDELFEYLNEVRDTLKMKKSGKYYCFFMVIMSHGNKDGMLTSDDKRVPLDQIFDKFKNDQIGAFAGKPRAFFIQSCRGSSEQGTVDLPDDEPMDICRVTIPTDSDMMVAYATTPGNIAYRRESELGAWFINALTQVFEKNYRDDHVEEMLISVRGTVATDTEYRTNTGKCQMPCTWTTFTKRLYLESSK